jgi:hypothetical protein
VKKRRHEILEGGGGGTLPPQPPTIASFSPTSGPVGTSVTITGMNFTAATSVTFDDLAASYTVDSPTQITATVPASATTGPITVTTPSGTATSQTDFSITLAFGVTTPGALVDTALAANFKDVSKYTAPQAGNVTKITVYLSGTAGMGGFGDGLFGDGLFGDSPGGSQVMRGVLYTDSAGSPSALLGTSNEVTIPSGQADGWVDFAFPTPVAISAGAIWMGGIFGTTTGIINLTRETAAANTEAYNADTYSDGAANPFGTPTFASFLYSIYATYTLPTNAPTITSFTPTNGAVGATITLTGTNFVGATSMKFNGVSASYVVNSNTQITATVPAGATTGTVSVTTPAGTATSSASFTVTPTPPVGKLWGCECSVNLTQSTRTRELQDMLDVGGGTTIPRVDGGITSSIYPLAQSMGITKWVAIIVGSGSRFPTNQEVIDYCNAYPLAYIEPCNEANIATANFTAAQLAALHISLYSAMKNAGVPNKLLLSSIASPRSRNENLLPLDFVAQLALHGCLAGVGFDIANPHMYAADLASFDASWMHVFAPDGNGRSWMTLLGNPPVMVTEFGWPIGSAGTEAAQATACTNAFAWMNAHSSSPGGVISVPQVIGGQWYAMSDDAPGTTTGYGLRRSDLSHRPSWDAYHTAVTA